MLILDYERWKHRDIPIVFYQFQDEHSPCIKTQCVIAPTCSKECNDFMDFLYSRLSETIAFLKEQLGTRYYEEVETGQTYNSSKITEALLKRYDPKVSSNELVITMSRYFYCMRTAWGICERRKQRCGSKPGDFYIDT